MSCIEPLLAKVTQNTKPRLLSTGVVCWVVYANPAPGSFLQSLSDIGGWSLASEKNQSLWFFPTTDVLLGLARLHNWARLQPMPTAITVFEGSLAVDEKLGQSLKVKSEMHQLCVEYPKRLVVRVSPRLRELARPLAGLSFRHMLNPEGLAGEWFELEGSDQVSVSYSLSWLWVIRPLGSRQDKVFSKGWRAYFERLEAIITQQKISYIQAEDHTLVLRIGSLRTMFKMVTEILSMIGNKQSPAWPCQYVAMDMGDNSFSPDFPVKIRYVLDSLEPNSVYLPLATIFQLAEPSIVAVDSRSSLDNSKLTDLFQVRLSSQEGGRRRGTVQVFLPASLLSGSEAPCFYCGLKSHIPRKCPSRILKPGNVRVSDLARFARIDMNSLPEIMLDLEKRLAPDVLQGMSALLEEKPPMAQVLRAVCEINMTCQMRMMAMVWRAKGKEWPRGIEEQRAQGDEELFEALNCVCTGSPERAMEKLDHFVRKSPKNYQPRILLGFMALERDELRRAAGFWEEAETLSYTSLQRSYLQLLQGRLREVAGDFSEATRIYGRAFKESSGFIPARYRLAVCLIKSGYLNEAQAIFRDLIANDPDCFSMVLLDPEVEGGRSHLLSMLWEIWDEARSKANEVIGSVEHLPDLLSKWLPENHDAYQLFHARITELNTHAGINNFASMARVVWGTAPIQADIQARVKKDIQELSDRRKSVMERLKTIQREASWFPVPALLKGFNVLFNNCGEKLNLLSHLDLYIPDKFRQGHEAMREVENSLGTLEKKFLFLQGVRNGILFLLLSGKYLLLFEIAALVLAGVFSAGIYFLAPDQIVMGRDLRQDRWLILNISLIFFSFLAFVGTAIRATSRFESFRNEMLSKTEE